MALQNINIYMGREPGKIRPDTWNMDQYFLNRLGNDEIQLALFYAYQSNLRLFPTWHE